MIRSLALYIAMLCAMGETVAQNLVPNPGFEEAMPCPNNYGQLELLAFPWLNFRASPDLFGACGTSGFAVPTNVFGSRVPADGQAYAGVYCYYSTLANRREYIGVQLTEPLVPGVVTYVSFKAAAASGVTEGWTMQHWTSHLGAKFSMDYSFVDKLTDTTTNEADIYREEVLADSPSWTTISGTFIPDSAYVYLMIGNFFSDDVITVQPTLVPGANNAGSYYYIDAVCVSQDASEPCDVSTALSERSTIIGTCFFDLASQEIIINGLDAGGRMIRIIDSVGRTVHETRVSGSRARVPASSLTSGIYFVQCDGTVVAKVLVP